MDDPRPASIHSLARKGLGPAQPVKAGPARITRTMRPEDVFRATLSDCLAQLTANAATIRAGRSVEGLHQLRVALRRLEVLLKSFGQEFEQDWLLDLRSRAKILSSRLGPARDLDVFLTQLLDAPAEGSEHEAFAHLRARIEDMREKAWKEAHECVAGADFGLFTEDVAGLAHSRLPLARDPKLSRVAKRLLKRQQTRALKRGRKARDGDEAHLHGLRIALKKLRYTAEFLAPLYPKRKVKHYVRQQKKRLPLARQGPARRTPRNQKNRSLSREKTHSCRKGPASSGGTGGGGRDRDRTCDPYHVKVVLSR
jgi:CHAD domain-containing protein